MRRVTVGVFAQVAEATRIEVLDCAREERKRNFLRARARRHQSLRVQRERPRPDRTVVVGRFSRGVLVACVDATVKRMPRVERSDAPRHQQLLRRTENRLVLQDSERDQEQLVRTNRIFRRRIRGAFAIRRRQAVAIAARDVLRL